jgi:hypothetical protein
VNISPVFFAQFLKGHDMKHKIWLLLILMLSACSIPVDQAPPPTALSTATPQTAATVPAAFTAIPTLTSAPAATQTTVPTIPPAFCNDPRATELIKQLTTAFASRDGALLSSLVSPTQGMDVVYYRDGKVINYDVEHAKFVFETTFEADWGLSFGSGEPTLGSFQDVVLPDLKVAFKPEAQLVCNQLKVGGATYVPEWPYPYLDYYSVHFPGTDEFGGLNWQTWGVGMEDVSGKLYVAALVHFVWEP